MKKRQHMTQLAALLAVALTCACAVQQAERIRVGAIEYGVTSGNFRGDFYDFYERGESYIEGALAAKDVGDNAVMQKAVELGMADLRMAIKLRDNDQRRARPYGMWFFDYFPHREMGIGYYLLGKYDDAIRELEGSLVTVESAKAQFFLDKARKERIGLQGGDTTPPTIQTGSLPGRTPQAEIKVSVQASDDGFVSELIVNGDPEEIPQAVKTLEIERTISLEEGENEILITAKDLSGNTAEKKLKIISDTSGPSVTVEESSMMPGSPARMKIKGYAIDPAGIKALQIGGLEITPGADGGFGVVVKLSPDGKVAFIAEDSLGNKTAGEVSPGGPNPQQGSILKSTLAGWINHRNVAGPLIARWITEMAQEGGQAGGPIIKFKGLTDSQTVYFESFYIEGEAYDPSGVASLVVGRQSLISKPGQKVYFNYLRRLHRGQNAITIVAKNGLGEASQKKIVVTREIPVVREVGSRMSLSMLPFHLKGQVNLADVAYEDLLKFLKESGRFRMVDRTMIEKAVRELKLSRAGLMSDANAVKAGKMVTAEVVLLGYVYETQGSIEVYGRLVDVQSSAILAEKDAYTRETPLTLNKLLTLMNGLSVKIRNQFPMVEGEVAAAQGNNIEAQLNNQAPLKPGTKLIIFREKPVTHPETGIPLGNQTIPVAEARIARAGGNTAAAVLTNANDSKKIRKYDKIITK